MSAQTTISLDEYLKLALNGDYPYELDEGELIPVSPTGGKHSRRLDRILRFLYRQLAEERHDILTGEPGFILSRDPKPSVRGADIAVMSHREEEEIPEGMFVDPPLLIVEVVSAGNNPEDIEKKRLQYVTFGVQEIWIVYQETRTVYVQIPADDKYFILQGQSVFLSSLGFNVPVEELFR